MLKKRSGDEINMVRYLKELMIFLLLILFSATATFATVEDTVAPIIKDIQISNPDGTFGVGDNVVFDITLEDESDIRAVTLLFYPVDRAQNFNNITARMVSYDHNSGIARASLSITENIPSTTWVLDSVNVWDIHGNTAYLDKYTPDEVDFVACSFTVAGTATDVTAPVISSITLANQKQAFTLGDSVEFEIALEDESDIRAVSLLFYMADRTQNLNNITARMVSYDHNSGIARASLSITEDIPSTTWVLDSVNVWDIYGNAAYLDKYSSGEVDFSACSFTVAGTATDVTAPAISSITLANQKQDYASGDTVEFEIALEDESDIRAVSLLFYMAGRTQNLNNITARMVSYDHNSGIARASLSITEDMPSATWVLDSVNVWDIYGNAAYLDKYTPGEVNFNGAAFVTSDPEVSVRYRLGALTVRDTNGAALASIPRGSFLVTIPVTKQAEGGGALVMLASYSASGQFKGLLYVAVKNAPVGTTVEVTLPVDNADGTIAQLKAFAIASFGSPIPLGTARTFPG